MKSETRLKMLFVCVSSTSFSLPLKFMMNDLSAGKEQVFSLEAGHFPRIPLTVV